MAETNFMRIAEEANAFMLYDPIKQVEDIYQLWRHWANFELYIVTPTIDTIYPPIIHLPEKVADFEEKEHVYPIYDWGNRLMCSKGEEMYTAGMSMCKLFYTIEKMIFLLIERLKSGGIDTETEVQVAFGGHEIAQRKAFETIINLVYNVVVTNFDPGSWGERYLQTVKRLAKDFGYPPEAPRPQIYRLHHGSSANVPR